MFLSSLVKFKSGSLYQITALFATEPFQTGNLLRTLTAHTGFIFAVAISPDGQFIVSGSGDKTVRVWDFQTGNLLRTLTAHTGKVMAIAISPDGQFIVSGGGKKDGKMIIYRTR